MADDPYDLEFRELQVNDLLEGAQEPLELPKIDEVPPSDYGAFVVATLARVARQRPASGKARIDQAVIRGCLTHASSFLITDSIMNPDNGVNTWGAGLARLIDLVVALHRLGELELDTIVAAQKSCKECWQTSGSFSGIEGFRAKVRESATKLRAIMDPNGKTYKGELVY